MMKRAKSGVMGPVCALCACVLLGAPSLAAQTSTGSIRGFVRTDTGEPVVGANVVATHVDTNIQRGAITERNGFFNLAGLQPGVYEVQTSSVGYDAQTQDIRLGVGQTVTLEFEMTTDPIALEAIVARAERRMDVRTQEVATNITQEQIENVPLNDRNFLSLAKLVPGVRSDGTSISSGAQSSNNINVFLDGVSFKNDLLVGGVVGQDASHGNPFPQDAVEEFRVITQQYKAEYQKATSAVITATTKSGTNEWQGSAFLFGQNRNLIAQDFITLQRCAENEDDCEDQPRQDKWQGGVSLGGPIIRDRLFFFATYEGHHQNRGLHVSPQQTEQLPPHLLEQFRASEGTFNAPVRSNLYFGKLTYVPSTGSPHRFELSTSIRDEYDLRNFGPGNPPAAREAAVHLDNNVYTYGLKHQYATSSLVNEASVSFQQYQWHPRPLTTDTINLFYEGIFSAGARCCMQDWVQERLSFRNDVTYTLPGFIGDHVFKVGANLDLLDYEIFQTNFVTPRFIFDASNNFEFPVRAQAGFGSPGVVLDNRQFGVYAQDDWTVTSQLTLNVGVRWDFENNEMNNEYVTPDTIRDALLTYAETLPCGEQSSDPTVQARQVLCDVDRYMTDGTEREAFRGAIQPRIGFSYDVFNDQRTVLFGGFGVYYDRNRYGNFISELQRGRFQTFTYDFSEDGEPIGTNPTIQWDDRYFDRDELEALLTEADDPPRGELHLMANDTRPPRTNQFTLGVRQAVGNVLVSANYTGVRGYNAYTMLRANRNPDGSCCEASPTGHWSNLFVSTDEGRNWYDAVYLQVDKPYTEESRWGAQLAYTLGWAEQNTDPSSRFGTLNEFTPETLARYPSGNDERHHVTANWMLSLPFDVRFSGIIDLGSGTPRNATLGFGEGANPCTHGNQDCLGGNDWPEGKERNWWRPEKHSFIIPNFWAFRNVDLRLEKRFTIFPGQEIGVIGEVFNVFDYANFRGFNTEYGKIQADGSVVPNENFGEPNAVVDDLRLFGAPRRFQLGMRYQF